MQCLIVPSDPIFNTYDEQTELAIAFTDVFVGKMSPATGLYPILITVCIHLTVQTNFVKKSKQTRSFPFTIVPKVMY